MDDLLKKFEELIKQRTVVFDYDSEDGFFIKVTDKSSHDYTVDVAELISTKHHSIQGAITSAVEYLQYKDENFKKLIDNIGRK